MGIPDNLTDVIAALSDPDEEARVRAAGVIFRAGRERAREAIREWLAHADVMALFVCDAEGLPEITVGIAVHPERFEKIRAAVGGLKLADVPAEHDAREFEAGFTAGVALDILTPRTSNGSGAIAKFLERSGEGIQQVELLCRDVNRATDLLKVRLGLAPLYPETRDGADGSRVNFFLLPTGTEGKLLVELVQRAREPRP